MSTQQIIVLLCIAGAALYLGRLAWAAWQRFRNPGEGGCATGCGHCGSAKQAVSRRRAIPMTPVDRNSSHDR
jgi:hypothetical protein